MTPIDYDLYSDSNSKRGLGITAIIFAIISFVALATLIVFYALGLAFITEELNLYLFYGFNGFSLIGIILGIASFKNNLGKIGFILNMIAFAGLGVFSVVFSLLHFVY